MKTAIQQQPENHLSNIESRWFAIYTNYKREKMVAGRLKKKGIEHFLPLQKVTRKYTRKVKHLELPLINCYLFVKIKKSEYIRVVETQDVLNFVRLSKNLISIPETEIDVLRLVVGENIEVEAQESRSLSLCNGDEVEILGGSLTGMKGILLNQKNEKNFVIELENMGYSLIMDIDPSLLRKIKSGSARTDNEPKGGRFKDYL
ncbi:UpxY family transcription antiterminator [Phaeodactylibacter xiamenensis]|jgi:transcription antitermination factor NusG|uniref:UpxY family transcription antiterminator n=1 Tax=Phaeodactylibacter xiamenensis TaxID=1524460 RepID=UPI0005C5164B|nr:UpxY family transcription antiterminator [Phaeodactylibacter xiamenensis]MCR9054232.1 UpxY family transcription antiterminator [bacterium]